MITLSTHHRKQMQDLARLNAKVADSIAEEIEHTDIFTPRREADTHVMREVEAGTFKRVNAARDIKERGM